MGNEVVTFPVVEQTANIYTYEVVDTIEDVAITMQQIAREHHFALVTIRLHFEVGGDAHYFLDHLRPRVRKTDKVFLHGDICYFVLLGANLQGGSIVQARLWDALLWITHNVSNEETLCPQRMDIGHSAYPEPYSDIALCLEAARESRQSFITYATRAAHVTHITHVETAETQKQADVAPQEEEELPVLARKLGVPYLTLLPRKLPAKVQQLVSPQLAQELHCYPVGRERGVLTVAMSDPQDRLALDRLRKVTGLHIFPVLAHPHELQMALDQLV